MVRKIRSAVAILLPVSINRQPDGNPDNSGVLVLREHGEVQPDLASLIHFDIYPGCVALPCFFAGVERLQGGDGVHRSALNTPKA
jgi:hypothetical protein